MYENTYISHLKYINMIVLIDDYEILRFMIIICLYEKI